MRQKSDAPGTPSDVPLIVSSPTSTGFLTTLGPGLVTGAADDDPSGIATYSQVGAQFGYGLAWTMLFSFPLMAVIQAVSARIGCVTGHGIAHNLRRHYSPWLLRASRIPASRRQCHQSRRGSRRHGRGTRLADRRPRASLHGVVRRRLHSARNLHQLRPLCRRAQMGDVVLFAYVAVVFAAHVPWGAALYGTFVPHFVFDAPHAMALVAVLGTTISPYLFFWQAGQEVEELHRRHVKPLCIRLEMPGRSFHAFAPTRSLEWESQISSPCSSSLPRQRR